MTARRSGSRWLPAAPAAALITGAMLLTRADIAYGLVIIWAVIGIALKHAGTPPVSIASWVVVGFVALLIAIQSAQWGIVRSKAG